MAGSLIPELLDLMPDTVTIRPAGVDDGMGNVTVGAPFTARCRIKGQHKLVKDDSGKETMSTVQVWLAGVFGVKREDEVTLPSRFSPQKPPIITVVEITDENGPHHERIMF